MKKDIRTQLINSITKNLRIDEDIFAVGMIEDAIEGIDQKQYKEFYNMLMGDDHDYLKPLDRVAKVAKHFKHTRSNELFLEAHTMAKDCYDKFYHINASMTTYAQENRDKVPNDREFFINMDYAAQIKGITKQDLYVLDELGGGEWIMDIKFITNSKDAIDKIESIIKTAITSKYLKPKHEAIAGNIKKAIAQ